MKRSTDRILTTHVGSLPRPDDLGAMIQKKARGEAIDEAAFAARVKSAVAETVQRQAEVGIDIVADGEMGRIGFIPYVNERLAGIEPSGSAESANYWGQSREYRAFRNSTPGPRRCRAPPGKPAVPAGSAPDRSPTRAWTHCSATSQP